MEKKNITKEELAEVKKIDLLTYLKNYESNELIKYSYNDYGTKTHSSLHIVNGMWRWYAKGINGRSALDYLIKVRGMKFLDAALYIHSLITHVPPTITKIVTDTNGEKGKLILPPPFDNNNKIINYLVNQRCIDRDIVQSYIDSKMLFEAKNDHSIIFVAYNLFGDPRFASKRGIDSNERRNLARSNKNFSFSTIDKLSIDLYVYESPIELMSNQTLLKIQGKNWRIGNHLSLDGVTGIGNNGIENSKLPISLEAFLSRNGHINTIHVCTNNDKAGHETFEKIRFHLSDHYSVIDEIPSTHNDLNDILTNIKKIKYKQNER